MRAAFLGTPASAVPALAALANVIDVDVVITRPDAAAGRSRSQVAPPVKVAAGEWGLEVAQPGSAGELADVLSGRNLDVGVVVAYGMILRPDALASTRFGFVNLHYSVLPRWRGSAPVERAILAGDTMTGVSLMLLDEGLDTGPVIALAETDIEPDETAGGLTQRLSYLGAHLLESTLEEFLAGARAPAPQLEAGVTHAPMLTTAEARLTTDASPEGFVRRVRAYNPRPGAWMDVDGKRVKVWRAAPSSESVERGVLDGASGVPVLGVAGGAVVLTEVQPEGKTRMHGEAWWRGLQVGEGSLDLRSRGVS